MQYLVTGSAGFIGFHVVHALLEAGATVFGFDSLSPYYDVSLKRARQAILTDFPTFTPVNADLADQAAVNDVFEGSAPDVVIHLAAQAGVRYSISHPGEYVSSNLIGTYNILEACRAHRVKHLMAASTSSVYGANVAMPFSEQDKADTPLTLYAATKKSCEEMAHAYAHLFEIPTTILRFFTVYGPWGRPDMALFKFTSAILERRPIELYNGGDLKRDFTFVDDVVDALLALVSKSPVDGAAVGPHDTLSPVAPHRVVNIGGGTPVELKQFVEVIEAATGREAIKDLQPMQDGDLMATSSSTALLADLVGKVPSTPIQIGVPRFVAWYIDYYGPATRLRQGTAPRPLTH